MMVMVLVLVMVDGYDGDGACIGHGSGYGGDG